MSTTDYVVELDVDIEYEVGSPAEGSIDPWSVQIRDCVQWTWRGRTNAGPTAGTLIAGMTRLYPPFTDATKRAIVGIFQWYPATPFVPATIVWDGTGLLGQFLLLTDSQWANPIVINDVGGIPAGGGGSWFAVEAEEEDDYRKWPQGTQENIVLE